MDFSLYCSLISQLQLPQILRLNYSGESVHYPHLIEAIGLASKTGAWVELVTAFASIPWQHIPRLVDSGLDRLTVSLHTTDPEQYRRIYRFSDLGTLYQKLEKLQAYKAWKDVENPHLDFAFVAMPENLDQLPGVAAYARQFGIREIFVHPVIRRDPIPELFQFELRPDGAPSEQFCTLLNQAISQAETAAPEVRIQVSSPALDTAACVGERPAYYPGTLPDGVRIHSCDQNPWETAHILANGDVVVCEVQDKQPLGNLRQQTLAEIWHGESYYRFRTNYVAGRNPCCCACPWKLVYRPAPPKTAIDAREGSSAQLLAGWHPVEAENGVVWNRGPSCLTLNIGPRSGRVLIKGVLPASIQGQRNTLEITTAGKRLGRIQNPGRKALWFSEAFRLPVATKGPVQLSFFPKELYWPARVGHSSDWRSLGFGLAEIAVVPCAGSA